MSSATGCKSGHATPQSEHSRIPHLPGTPNNQSSSPSYNCRPSFPHNGQNEHGMSSMPTLLCDRSFRGEKSVTLLLFIEKAPRLAADESPKAANSRGYSLANDEKTSGVSTAP